MQCLDPQTVELKDALRWFKQSFELISRRYIAYTASVTFFLAVLYVASQSTSSLTEIGSPIVTVSLLIIFSAFAFFFILANLILLSHWADRSERFNFQSLLNAFMPNQKVFFQMALLVVAAGLFFWYVTIIFHPEKSLLTSSSGILDMLASGNSLVQFIASENAVFLYFVLIVSLIFRTFFSVPLILFHQLSYREAQSLSQKALVKNLRVLSQIMLLWVCVLLLTIQFAPVLAVLLLPVFATFIYVSFRHIFWRQGNNETTKEVVHNVIATRIS